MRDVARAISISIYRAKPLEFKRRKAAVQDGFRQLLKDRHWAVTPAVLSQERLVERLGLFRERVVQPGQVVRLNQLRRLWVRCKLGNGRCPGLLGPYIRSAPASCHRTNNGTGDAKYARGARLATYLFHRFLPCCLQAACEVPARAAHLLGRRAA